MSFFRVGSISAHFKRRTVIILLCQFFLILAFLGYHTWKDSSAGCIECHGNKNTMQTLGYPQFYVTQEMVEKQSNHPNVKCHECHLGNGRAKDPAKAHKSMLKALIISKEGTVLQRKHVHPDALIPSDKDSPLSLLSKMPDEVRNILWHDRNPETFNFDPNLSEKTCGKSSCHPQEHKQFIKTTMATNLRQRTMKTWVDPYGPHNCGPSFADLPPQEILESSAFDFKNQDNIMKNLNIGFTKEQAIAKQKFCNVCHAGCLDCHYNPSEKTGSHGFAKKPGPQTCMGYGRGTTMCHTGAMEMRRGSTYIGGSYTQPDNMQADVHYAKNISCTDCHQTGEKGMGDIKRKAVCLDCHSEIETAHAKSIHKNLECAACHINELRGYQITAWGPGLVSGEKNPFKKYSLYYGIQKPPVLMKNQAGKWMPVKVWPHSVANIKNDVKPSEKILFRWPKGLTQDAYYIVGTFDIPQKNSKHLLWLEIEQSSHSYGKSRKCGSCHSKQQTAVSNWEFYDDQAAEPFKGTYRITANRNGLRVVDIHNTTPIKLLNGSNIEDFAAWLFLKNAWKAPGDLSITVDRLKYRQALFLSDKTNRKIENLDAMAKRLDKKQVKHYRLLRGILLHNEQDAEKILGLNSEDIFLRK